MNRPIRIAATLMAALFASGCAMMAPAYSPSVQNAQALKDAQVQSAKVGEFVNQPGKGNANPVSIRGSKMSSPYQNSYSSYLGAAVREELLLAGKLKDDSQVEITGTLLKNDIDAAGFSEATGNIEARFLVKNGGAVRYDEVKAIGDTWDSSFMGNVAIPRAQQRYPVIVQKLLTALFADPKFIEALK